MHHRYKPDNELLLSVPKEIQSTKNMEERATLWEFVHEECKTFNDYAYILQNQKVYRLGARSNNWKKLIRNIIETVSSPDQIQFVATLLPKDSLFESRKLLTEVAVKIMEKDPSCIRKIMISFGYL
jgi:hypothetical protein